MPTYAHPDDAGLDLYSDEELTLWPRQDRLITTNIAMEIPTGYFGLLRSRSGLAVNSKLRCMGSGVIDEGYRGDIKVHLFNFGYIQQRIETGQRIAQLLILPVLHAALEEVDELSKTARGQRGHGSTGQ